MWRVQYEVKQEWTSRDWWNKEGNWFHR